MTIFRSKGLCFNEFIPYVRAFSISLGPMFFLRRPIFILAFWYYLSSQTHISHSLTSLLVFYYLSFGSLTVTTKSCLGVAFFIGSLLWPHDSHHHYNIKCNYLPFLSIHITSASIRFGSSLSSTYLKWPKSISFTTLDMVPMVSRPSFF